MMLPTSQSRRCRTTVPGTYENKIMANNTKYATLASNGRAVFKERIIVCIKCKSHAVGD